MEEPGGQYAKGSKPGTERQAHDLPYMDLRVGLPRRREEEGLEAGIQGDIDQRYKTAVDGRNMSKRATVQCGGHSGQQCIVYVNTAHRVDFRCSCCSHVTICTHFMLGIRVVS
jgi:hypothetical protein